MVQKFNIEILMDLYIMDLSESENAISGIMSVYVYERKNPSRFWLWETNIWIRTLHQNCRIVGITFANHKKQLTYLQLLSG